MAQPPAYNKSQNYANYAVANPSAPFPAAATDSEFSAVETTLDAINTNLALIQRDDGLLKNGSVHPDSLSAATRVLISDWNPRGDWAAATVYALKDVVEEAGVWYVCIVAHTAVNFATDLAAARWMAINLDMAGLADTDNPLLGDFLLGVKLDATGAVARTQHGKNADVMSVKDFGAVGDGVTDDTAAIQASVDSLTVLMDGTGQAGTILFPRGKYKISSVITVPPAIILCGDGVFAATNATVGQGSFISVTHNGVGIRFTRTNASPGSLFHLGGMKDLSVSGPGTGTSVKLVELGDSGNVDTSHGAWNGFIHNCFFNYATEGYGIYSAHSQSWDIRNCFFRAVKFGIYYNTVVAGAVIDHNTFDNSGLAGGSAGCAIFMRPGTLGGSVGVTITDNYAIGNDYGIWLCSIGGAHLTGNQLEGCYFDALILTKYLFDQVTADGSGCYNCTIEGNTFIAWNQTAPYTYAAIQVSYSFSNYVGKNCYQSPVGTTGFGINVYDATTIGNIFVKPIITGANPTTLPFPVNNSVLAQNTIHAENYLGLASTNVPSTSGYSDGELGRMWWDTGKLSIWATIAGSSQGVNRIRLDGNRSSTNEGATVDVTGATTVVIRNAAPQTVTAFTDAAVYPGKEVTFYADNDANTTFGAGLGTRGAGYNLPQYAAVTFVYISAGIGWSEKCRKD